MQKTQQNKNYEADLNSVNGSEFVFFSSVNSKMNYQNLAIITGVVI